MNKFILGLAGGVAMAGGLLPAGRAQSDVAALKAKSQALDEELGREMRRLQVYLNYVDQTFGMQIAQDPGTGTRDASAQLARLAAALYERSYTESELAARVTEHASAGEKLFRFIEQQIASSGRWPTDRAPQDYRALARTELQAIRAQFAALRSNPAGLVPILSRAVKTLGWTRGETSVSGDRDPFAQSAERVIVALTEQHGRYAVKLSRGAPPNSTAASPPTSSAPSPRVALPTAAANTAGAPSTPADVSQILLAANSAFGQSNLAEARRLFELAAQTKPDSAEAWIGLGRCQNAAGELDAALQSYGTAQRTAPDTPNLRTWLAELCLAKGDRTGAQRWLDEELRAQPNSAWAWSWLGSLQLEAGNPAAAQPHFQRAVQLDPGVVEFRYQSANWMGRNHQPRRALMDSLAVLAMNPNHAGACYAAAECSAQLGRSEQAVQYFERYLKFDAVSEWAQKARTEIKRLKSAR